MQLAKRDKMPGIIELTYTGQDDIFLVIFSLRNKEFVLYLSSELLSLVIYVIHLVGLGTFKIYKIRGWTT